MARTTRSTANVQEKEKDKPAAENISSRTKPKTKKRKRDSLAELEDQPFAKILRQENSTNGVLKTDSPPPTSLSADSLLDSANAQQILDILEMVDTQGLLDRVFPLSTESSESPPVRSCSFRTLLQESSQHPLRVLRAAIQHLFPISSHSRSRSSTPGAQQLRFCNLALSLLELVSQAIVPISLDEESLFSSLDVDSTSSPVKRRKYALMQKLPSGEWWTSLNSDMASSSQLLRDLGVGHAELVSILPTPSTSTLPPDLPTLADYAPKKASKSRIMLPKHRLISRGSFLEYGCYASFAPTFEQAGREVGRIGLGEMLFAEKRYEQRAKAMEKLRRKRPKGMRGQDVAMNDAPEDTAESSTQSSDLDAFEDSMKGLLTRDQMESLKYAFEGMEIEASVQKLLDHNATALIRLEELQMERLGNKGGFRAVEVGSEEWDTAQAIMDSFTVLASLRPKTPSAESLIPSAAVLRRLHRTLPLDASPGWYGNLPSSRTTALRDDTTIHLKSGARAAALDPSLTSRTTAPPKPAVPTTPYAAYPTASYAYPATAYGTYTPSQGSYYQNYGSSTASGYPNQQYASSWYGNYNQSQTNSGRATPVVATPLTSNSTMYQAPSVTQPQRAVANTVMSSSTTKAWTAASVGTGGTAGYSLTLPVHLRNAGSGSGSVSQPGTPNVYQQTLR